MPTVRSGERGEYTLFHAVNHMVWEARRNDEITKKYGKDQNPDLFPDTDKLLQSLTRQGPNRIYFAPDGKICRVLFYSEEDLPYQARIETLRLQPDPKIVKSEGIVARNSEYLEREISWWRSQFGMSGDLLQKPLLILESLRTPGEIVHVGGRQRYSGNLLAVDNLVYFRYYISNINGPRVIDMGKGKNYIVHDDEEFTTLSQPPNTLLKYAHPFSQS